ncbi:MULTISPECIES: hypothetical protein [unclassified Chryseobacterium]|uniref:hypothetical protein n=1 Tax=unclassified Chryseobacterium TaxID=2593645 RepID=UPI001AE4B7A8|nr:MULTISPECIES: hypothetical protein [unclassified Chryseobacterium]MBP1163498.1 putative membrane protein [Chryseobacterium sp. PvR013]MDR4894313.1 hypothetical protein [Chryseobacterium sp. CFS7]
MKPLTLFLSLTAFFTSAGLYANPTDTTLPVPKVIPITDAEKWIAFSPILLFLLITCLVFFKLKKDKVSLKDLLLDKDANVQMEEEKTKQMEAFLAAPLASQQAMNEAATTLNTTTESNAQKPNTSVSRFLAFISGLVSVGLACVLTTFAIWNYFDVNVFPNLNDLVGVLLTLGIGVVPYAFNKVTTAAK